MAASLAASHAGFSTKASTTTTPRRGRGSDTKPSHALRLSARKYGSFGGLMTVSTPNLHAAFSKPPPLPTDAHHAIATAALSRKQSLAALSRRQLATIPDEQQSSAMAVLPYTPAKARDRQSMGQIEVEEGDLVDVPGNMYGTVRFVGPVEGRKGMFAGVELHEEYASRGKNSGDVDGISYFTTEIPGAGMFLPLSKASKRQPTTPSAMAAYPYTPGANGALKSGVQNPVSRTPPTPSIPKFSQSVGPGRASSPTGRRLPRQSLPRPESPVRRPPVTPAGRQSLAAPSAKNITRYGSPAPNKFSKSVAGPAAGDPSKRVAGQKTDRSMNFGPRSASALGQRAADYDHIAGTKGAMDPPRPPSVLKFRTTSRAESRAGIVDEEVERLRAEVADRDRQLQEQAATLIDMETSLTEVQSLMEQAEGINASRLDPDERDLTQLRSQLRQKSDKIAMLTAEFDAHRADFRSTIDTLEMASTETERVYEKKIEEMTLELRDAQERTTDVDSVAQQLKGLEELVQELEEGLEDARRGEAEARGEVEFLRGEVERTRAELRREREKAEASVEAGQNGTAPAASTSSKELEQKEDEIRGLKAIIHSLSRDSIPSGDMDKAYAQRTTGHPNASSQNSLDTGKAARDKLEREVADLRSLLNNKSEHEEQMQRELETLRRASAVTARGGDRSSLRDSRSTVIMAKEPRPKSPDPQPLRKAHNRALTLETMPESDGVSNATESSTLWCELCETNGHDILGCTAMFGADAIPASVRQQEDLQAAAAFLSRRPISTRQDIGGASAPIGAARTKPWTAEGSSTVNGNHSGLKAVVNQAAMDGGPVAGKESGVIDGAKWCALCERDGHDSVDCPFEDAF